MVLKEIFFSALDNAGTNPEALKERIKMLTHHVCDEHEWDGVQCDFHNLIVCSCGECKGDEITCAGKRYKSRLLLDCPYHNLAYFVKLHNRSKLVAEKVIDKELGRLGISDFDGVRAYSKEKNRKREAQHLERQTTEYKKQAFIAKDKHRHIEQEKRMDYTKKDKQIHHTYL